MILRWTGALSTEWAASSRLFARESHHMLGYTSLRPGTRACDHGSNNDWPGHDRNEIVGVNGHAHPLRFSKIGLTAVHGRMHARLCARVC
jgi:hypothetical protein